MGNKWTDQQIETLLEEAKRTFRLDIPLATEIRHLNHFVWEMGSFYTEKDTSKFKITRVVFSWWHRGRERTSDIEVPFEVAMRVWREAMDILDMKCTCLSDLLGRDKGKED